MVGKRKRRDKREIGRRDRSRKRGHDRRKEWRKFRDMELSGGDVEEVIACEGRRAGGAEIVKSMRFFRAWRESSSLGYLTFPHFFRSRRTSRVRELLSVFSSARLKTRQILSTLGPEPGNQGPGGGGLRKLFPAVKRAVCSKYKLRSSKVLEAPSKLAD